MSLSVMFALAEMLVELNELLPSISVIVAWTSSVPSTRASSDTGKVIEVPVVNAGIVTV